MNFLATIEPRIIDMSHIRPVAWPDSYKLYGERHGSYNNYADGRIIGQYHEDYYFAECRFCGDVTKICPDRLSAVDEHFKHCSLAHNYVYPYDKQLKVHDRGLQDFIRLAQEYGLPIPWIDNHSECIKQYIQLTDGSQIVGCGIHKGNKAKIWMGAY